MKHSKESGTGKGHVVEKSIPLKDLAEWQPYPSDKIAYGPALKNPRPDKK